MKALLLFFLFTALVTAFPTKGAHGKCLRVPYEVNGKILNEKNEPVGDARIVIFFDDDEFGNSTTTAQNGEFSLIYKFYSYKGLSFLLQDECGKLPSRIVIIITHEKYCPIIQHQKISRISADNGTNTIELPPVHLDKSCQ